jgi:hypothetical protein
MATRPNVSLTVVDDSIVIPTQEPASPTIGMILSSAATGLPTLKVFGTTAEKNAGYYYVPSLNDWIGRLQTFTKVNYNLGDASGLTFIARDLLTNGATAWTDEWYAVNNFLQYGAPCYVGFTGTITPSGYEAITPDVIFAGTTKANARTITFAETKVAKNEPVFAVLSSVAAYFTDSTLAGLCGLNANGITGIDADAAQFSMVVHGEKTHLNQSADGTNFITSSLAPDVAGCFARTDRTAFPWISPAGVKRGQILNVISLTEALSDTQQDNLYTIDINPIVTFSGEGTYLFGDKTFNVSNSSTLDAVNVSRLVIYLRKVLGQLGRTILFEQNDSISRNRFLTSADAILRNVKAQSGISDYKIICDETNNPPSVIQARQFVADVLIKAIPSINFVKITITNKSLTATL